MLKKFNSVPDDGRRVFNTVSHSKHLYCYVFWCSVKGKIFIPEGMKFWYQLLQHRIFETRKLALSMKSRNCKVSWHVGCTTTAQDDGRKFQFSLSASMNFV